MAPTVVIGFAESFAAIEAARSLQKAGFTVVAFTRTGARAPLRHLGGVDLVEVTPPESDAGAFLAEMTGLVKDRGAAAVLPLDDAALWMTTCADLGESRVAGPTREGALVALNKADQVAAAAAAGLLVPATRIEDLAAIQFEGEPFIIKPADAVRLVDGRLTRPPGRFCGSAAELLAAQSELAPGQMLVQPVIKGRGVGIFGSIGAVPTPWSAHERVRMVNPSGSASSACDSRDVDEDLRAGTELMLDRLGWQGLFMTEFLEDDGGRSWFMELNGRAWGSLALARRRGLEYPAWAVQSTLEIDLDPAPPQSLPDIRARHLGREILHLVFVFRGPTSTGVASWPGRWATVRNLLHVTRRDRLYNWDGHGVRVLLADTWKTLTDQLSRLRRSR